MQEAPEPIEPWYAGDVKAIRAMKTVASVEVNSEKNYMVVTTASRKLRSYREPKGTYLSQICILADMRRTGTRLQPYFRYFYPWARKHPRLHSKFPDEYANSHQYIGRGDWKKTCIGELAMSEYREASSTLGLKAGIESLIQTLQVI